MHIQRLFFSILILSCFGCFCSCSSDDDNEIPKDKGLVSVDLDISFNMYMRPKKSADETVNRILILPFRKIDENLSDDDNNFEVAYSAAKQIDINAFPTYITKLILEENKSYQVLILGYKQNDFDFSDQDNAGNIFRIGSSGTPVTLENFQVSMPNIAETPELFACISDAYLDEANKGNVFKPENISKLKGNLTRRVSRLTVGISEIPDYVSSISLEAEYIVTAFKPVIGDPVTVQSTDNNGNNILAEQSVGTSRVVKFSRFLFPTKDVYKTRLYINVLSGSSTTQYQIKVADVSGASEAGYILFYPNNEIRITGRYDKLDSGMTINNTIGLDEDEWNGGVSE
ncbi:MAG: hypothetical protein ACLVKO_01470 [Dysgonomonas sp.]